MAKRIVSARLTDFLPHGVPEGGFREELANRPISNVQRTPHMLRSRQKINGLCRLVDREGMQWILTQA